MPDESQRKTSTIGDLQFGNLYAQGNGQAFCSVRDGIELTRSLIYHTISEVSVTDVTVQSTVYVACSPYSPCYQSGTTFTRLHVLVEAS